MRGTFGSLALPQSDQEWALAGADMTGVRTHRREKWRGAEPGRPRQRLSLLECHRVVRYGLSHADTTGRSHRTPRITTFTIAPP